MKNKKSLIAIVAVLLVIVVGVTFAYFTSSATFNNQFNLGNYSITTQEVFESPDNWAPGDTTPKTITATNNGTIDAAVRVSFTEAWTDENGDSVDSSNIPNDAVTINFTTPSDWTENNGYYYYNYILKPRNTTSSLIESVTLNPNLNNSNCTESNGVKTCTSNLQGLAGYHYTLTFTIETVQYDQYQSVWNTNQSIVKKPAPIQIMNQARTKDTLQLGDEVCVNGDTTECFNFIRYDGEDIVLLAKYNLKVGNKVDITDPRHPIWDYYESNDPGYGLQSSEAKGYDASSSYSYGGILFAPNAYWGDDNSSELKTKYGTSYPADVYDSEYITAPNFSNSCGDEGSICFYVDGYSIAYFVEAYKDILEEYGLTIKNIRLLTYSEATSPNIGCSGYSCPTTTGFLTNTSFFLGTAKDSYDVWYIVSNGGFDNNPYEYFYYNATAGVRPVIVIRKSDM